MGDLLLQDLEVTESVKPESTETSYIYANTTVLNGIHETLVEKTAAYFQDCLKLQTNTVEVEKTTTGITPWHSALAQGNQTFVKGVLDLLQTAVRKQVVNTLVDYTKPGILQGEVLVSKILRYPQKHSEIIQEHYKTAQVCKHSFKDIEYQLPLSIAATSGKFEILKILLENSCDLFQTDVKGNNIIHHLTYLSQNHSNLALQIFQDLLDWIDSTADKQQLIKAKNHRGLQPLDEAMKHMSVEFAWALLNTTDVYKFAVKDCGIFQHVLYDVTDFEAEDSTKLHIFHYLATIVETDLPKLKDTNFLNLEPMKSWIASKVESHKVQTIVWGVSWVVLLTLYFVTVGVYLMQSGKPPPSELSVALLINSSILLLGEISNMYSERHIYKIIYRNSHKGLPIAFSPAYRVFHLLFALSLSVTECLHLVNLPCSENKSLFVALYVLNAVFGLSSLLLFTQLNQHTGHLLIIIDRMMWDVVLFISVAGIIFFAFALAFYLLHAPPMCADPNNTIVWVDNRTMFASFTATVYETQLLALGIMAPKSLYFEESQIPVLSMTLYIVFLIMLCIVLLNLLIAIMSDRVSELSKHKHTIMQIQALSLAMFLESKMKIANKIFGKKCNPFRGYHQKTLERFYISDPERNQVFLHVLEKIPQMINCNGKDLTSISTMANMKIFVHKKVNKKGNNVQPIA